MAHIAEPVSEQEAANLDRLGNYAFTYGTLLALTNLGLLGLMTMVGLPLSGDLGALDVYYFLFRLMSALAIVLGVYALYCHRHSNGRTRLRASLKIFAVAIAFALLSADYGDSTPALLNVLEWIGTDCAYCIAEPLL